MLFLSVVALFTFVGKVISAYSRVPQAVTLVLIGIIIQYFFGEAIISNEALNVYVQIVVALVLFLAGIRFSPLMLRSIKRAILFNGIFQIFLICVILFPILLFFDLVVHEAVVFSLLLSFSSWLFIEQIIEKKGLLFASSGKNLHNFLFAQTLLVIPVVFFVPALFAENFGLGVVASTAFSIIGAIFLFVVLFFVERQLYLKIVSRLNLPSVELHILYFSLFIAGSFWLFAQVGVAYMFSAFLIGMILSRQGKIHPFISSSSPIRNFLLSLFFILLGSLLDVSLVYSMIPALIFLSIAIVFVKFLSVLLALRNTSFLLFPAVFLSSAMSGVGEISFAVAFFAYQEAFINVASFQLFLSLFILSFVSIPYSNIYFVKIFEWGCRRGYLGVRGKAEFAAHEVGEQDQRMQDHVIICGFGKTGREVQNLLDVADISYVVIDIDKSEHNQSIHKNKTFFEGDPTDREILYSAGIVSAKALVIVVRDIHSQEKIIRYALSQNPQITIVCRSEDEEHRYKLLNLGANTIVTPDFEAGIRLGQAVLYAGGVKNENITAMIKKIRKQHFID